MLKKTITLGGALAAYNMLSHLSQLVAVDYMFRLRAGLNAQELQPLAALAQAQHQILERQYAQPAKPADAKEAESWKPWTPEETAEHEKAREKAWQEELAADVEVAVPGIRWADLEAQDAKVGIGGDVVAALLFLLTDLPPEVQAMLKEAGE